MSPQLDLSALQPSDEERDARRRALVAEIAGTSTAPPAAAEVPRSSRRAFVRGGVAVAGVAAVGLASVDVLPGLGGSPVDVVASARAATAPTSGILHTVVRYEHGPGISMAWIGRTNLHPEAKRRYRPEVMGRLTGDTESWTSDFPPRERQVMFVDLTDSDEVGRSETSQGERDSRMHASWDDFVIVRRVDEAEYARWVRARRRAARRLGQGFGTGMDPVAAVRTLLDLGRLRAAGKTELGGRPVARLVGRAPSYVDSGGTTIQPVDYEYLVDAQTYVPVRISSTQVLPARPHDEEPAARHERRIVQRWTFEVFERLPLTPENERLLTVDATGLRVVRPPTRRLGER